MGAPLSPEMECRVAWCAAEMEMRWLRLRQRRKARHRRLIAGALLPQFALVALLYLWADAYQRAPIERPVASEAALKTLPFGGTALDTGSVSVVGTTFYAVSPAICSTSAAAANSWVSFTATSSASGAIVPLQLQQGVALDDR